MHSLGTKRGPTFIADRVRNRELLRNYVDDQLPFELLKAQAPVEVWGIIQEKHQIYSGPPKICKTITGSLRLQP